MDYHRDNPSDLLSMVLAVFICKNSGNVKDRQICVIEPDLDNLGCLL